MDSVAFLKFWKLAASPTSNAILSGTIEEGRRRKENQKEEEEGGGEEGEEEDSFFDLELLSFSGVETQRISDESGERREVPTKLGDHIKLCSDDRKRELQTDSISKRKILPIEPNSKPQSPIQLLKSAPKFPVFIFKKQKSMAKNRAEPSKEEETGALTSKLTRENSTTRIGSILRKLNDEPLDPSAAPTRRFSKETVQKYLKLIKPKVLKKPTDNGGDPSPPAVDSPMREKHENSLPAGIRLVCKHLGKSKSASASASAGATGVLAAPPPKRRDDSLLQQHDGIQSAILHCKRSFNSSTEHPLFFSRSETAASQERPRSLSCKDFSFKESKEERI